jgi:hypothetical protein
MFRGSVLACALLFTAPIWWQAVVDQSVSVQTAVVRFLIAVPVAAVLLALVRAAAKHDDARPNAAKDTGPAR